MSELKICRVCLRTEVKGYKFDRFHLKYFYEEVIALKVSNSDGLPQWFCFECATMLHKFHMFKEKCYTGQKLLKELLWKGPITYKAVYKIDRSTNHLISTLGTITINSRVKEFAIKGVEIPPEVKIEDDIIQELKSNDEPMKLEDDCKIMLHTEINSDHQYAESNECTSNESRNKLNYSDGSFDEPHSPTSIIVGQNNIFKFESEDTNTNKSKNIETSLKDFSNKYLHGENWKISILTEEEALVEFQAKAEDPKYLATAYKCTDCFKGFSKIEMLNRHIESRHCEELGQYECRFCHMRFKWNCYLQKHLRQHYTKYECLRCHIVFHLDTSALLHEEYHSGITKKCAHCNEEFRHVTTYYTHLRTHPSAHVCAQCGAAFVSAAGLRQHLARGHMESQEESEEDELTDTFCEKCDIRFKSRKAFEEHLFHSVMHIGVFKKEEENDEIIPNKKIQGKRMKAKITKELRNEKQEDTTLPGKAKRQKRIRQKIKIPTTCYQCGEHFETQSACMKHHLAAHPGTCFTAPAQRYICEHCGASLAPGSVAMHRNIHTRALPFPCGTCGRVFYSGVGLKRHLVTHTGEKPFGCSLCDKRFTQSNSMKLHYRTYHLKQPYPKRKRRDNRDLPNQGTEQEESYEEDSNSLPEPEFRLEPDVEPVHEEPAQEVEVEVIQQQVEAEMEVENDPEVPTVAHNVVIKNVHLDLATMGDGEIHYLTLS